MGEGGEGYDFSGINLLETSGGKRYANRNNAGRKRWTLEFANMPTADKDEMMRIYYRTKGYPLYFSLNSNSATPTIYYGRLMNVWACVPVSYGRWNWTVEIEEEI
jgi:hypothetical protein